MPIISNFPTGDAHDKTYGVCATDAATAAKVVTLDGFKLEIGASISIEFDNANTASNPTLDVNDTGAKPIMKYGTTAADANMWQAGAVVRFTYDGTNWVMENGMTATTECYGVTKLSSDTDSTATNLAATPSAVKSAYDKANAALPKSGGTLTGDLTCESMVTLKSNINLTSTKKYALLATADGVSGMDNPCWRVIKHDGTRPGLFFGNAAVGTTISSDKRCRIFGVGTPICDSDAAPKDYVDSKVAESGVTSFNGRTGEVTPQAGDYTADQVGALPLSGGTLTGDLRIKGSGNYGTKINLGDGDYVHFYEPTDDCLEIKAKKINFVVTDTSDSRFTLNGSKIGGDNNVDLSGYAPIANPVFTGSISMGRETDTTIGEKSVAFGLKSVASGRFSFASGWGQATGEYSCAIGWHNDATGDGAAALGASTLADSDCTLACGRGNKSSGSYDAFFVVGKGISGARANGFRVTSTGLVYGSGSYNSSGADYAELFQWADGNPDGEDRVGRFVTLEGEYIRLAEPQDNFILGAVSGAPSVTGDVHDDQWHGMFLTDIFGRPIMEDVEIPAELDEEGNEIIPPRTEHRQKLNPSYDNSQDYVPRSQRPEWDAVGLLGKLVLVDDGTCTADSWCAPGPGGIATHSESQTRFRVLSRLDEEHIRVLVM